MKLAEIFYYAPENFRENLFGLQVLAEISEYDGQVLPGDRQVWVIFTVVFLVDSYDFFVEILCDRVIPEMYFHVSQRLHKVGGIDMILLLGLNSGG